MAYQPLRINSATPQHVAEFIHEHVDMQFHDVHCMLRLPMKSGDLNAGCNFAAGSFLLSLIAGLSTALYPQPKGPGCRFRGLLKAFYPWDLEPSDGVGKGQGPCDLWTLFRNPVAHALGLDTQQQGKGATESVVLWRDKNRPRLGIAKAPEGLSEAEIEALENATTRPTTARGTLLVSNGRKKLSVAGLYWGTREMVTRLTADRAAMAGAAQFLRDWRDAV